MAQKAQGSGLIYLLLGQVRKGTVAAVQRER
jgi:hypothetical protein